MDKDVGESALVNLLESFSHRAGRGLSDEYVHVRVGGCPNHALQQQQIFHIYTARILLSLLLSLLL